MMDLRDGKFKSGLVMHKESRGCGGGEIQIIKIYPGKAFTTAAVTIS